MRVKVLNENATIPTYGTIDAAGADLYSALTEEVSFEPHETKMIPTGIALEIPKGYVGHIYARSSVSTKRGLAPATKVSVIDSDYRGELFVPLHNHSNTTQVIEPKEKIAQIVITPYIKETFEVVDSLEDTERGSGGFGSTGTK